MAFTLVLWSRLFAWKSALMIVKPDTLIGWHRKGFKLFWRWRSRPGRPPLPHEIRELIVHMGRENPTWGQMRVAAELYLKLGILLSPEPFASTGHWKRMTARDEEFHPSTGPHSCAIMLPR